MKRRTTIRPVLTYAEAEALLVGPEHSDPRVNLRARGKLSTLLLADREYVPPLMRTRRLP